MFVTEEDAKTKWCPFARATIGTIKMRASTEAIVVGNRNAVTGQAGGDARCLGSVCMAWKWNTVEQMGRCGLAGDA